MKAEEKYHSNEELAKLSSEELCQIVKDLQQKLQILRWKMKEVQELLIAAIQSLPKNV